MTDENEAQPGPEETDDVAQQPQELEPDAPDATDELDEDPEHDEIDAQPEAKPSRAETRFQKLSNTAREANERAARLEREIQELRAAQQRAQPQEREPTPDEMALWSIDQIINYRLEKAQKTFDQRLGAIQLNTFEQSDKAAWASKCATNQQAQRMSAEVEEQLQAMRRAGQNVEREKIYYFLLGQRVDSGRAKAKEKQTADGQRRIQRQQARPPQAQGDTPSQRGRLSEREERLKRLENMTF